MACPAVWQTAPEVGDSAGGVPITEGPRTSRWHRHAAMRKSAPSGATPFAPNPSLVPGLTAVEEGAPDAGEAQAGSVRLLTVAEVAALLRINPNTLYRWTSERPEKAPVATMIGGRKLFRESDVRKFIENPPPVVSMRGRWPRPKKGVKCQAQSPVRRRGRPTKVELAARGGSAM